jgi:putative ABC transport system permease protein
MRWIYKLPLRFRSLLQIHNVEQELSDELRFHLERLIEEQVAKGMTPEDARYSALRALGGVEQIKEECRDMRRINYIENFLQDVRYGLRQLRRSPGFAAVAVITLALGIGANTAIFSVVNAVLLRPLPFPEPDRIVQLIKQYKNGTGSSISVPLFNYWKLHNQVFSHLTAFSFAPIGFNLATRGLPERVPGARVTAEFFQVLAVNPSLGRSFLPEEDRPDGGHVVVLGYHVWRSRFDANPGLVGQAISLDGQPYTVVGIMPQGFRFPASSDFGSGTDLWIPLQLPLESRDQANYLVVIGRLKPDVTRKQAAASMSILTQQLRKDFPQGVDESETATLVPLHERLVGNIRPALLVLMGAVGLVLLIACVNVANLMLSRAAGRGKEIAIRTALGAARGRIAQQLTVESVLLAILGGALGLLAATGGDRLLIAFSPVDIPQFTEAGVDWRVLVFTLGVSVLTGILFGIAPALSASRTDPNEPLKEGSLRSTAGGRHRRLSGVLVVGEIALSLMLLAGAGLLLGSFVRLANVDPGFDPRYVLTFETTLPESKYGTPPALSTFYREVLERLQALPGVEAAANVTNLPTEFGPDFPFNIEGRAESNANQEAGDSQYRVISPGYFRVMRIPLLRGRYFNEADTEASPGVVIINATMARQSWPHQDPVGQTIIIAKTMGPEWTDRSRQVVGVVGDVKDTSLDEAAPPEMFVPNTQVPAHMTALMVRVIPTRWVLRTKGDPHSLTSAAAHAVLAVDANEPIAAIKTMEEVVSGSISRWRFNTLLLGIFSALAMILAAVGIYGVLSYSVARRTHEIGIRMALGAKRGDVLKMVVGQGFSLTLVGVGIGIVGAMALTRFLSSLLYGVKPTDPMTYVVVSLFLTSVALLACYIPARRAMKVDPMVALRHE